MKLQHSGLSGATATIVAAVTALASSSLKADSGILDKTFSTDGIATIAAGMGAYGNAMAIQSNGKIVIAGQYYNSTNYDIIVARLNTNGSPDTTFSGDGIVTAALGSGTDSATGVAIQSNGKIVVCGYTSNGPDYDFVTLRYNTNGTLDTTFSGDGIMRTNFHSLSPYNDYAQGVAIQADQKIVVAGRTDVAGGLNPNYDFAVARYLTNGAPDTSFGGGDGKVTTPIGSSHDFANCVAIQGDQKIVLAGEAADSGGMRRFALARYLSSGALDSGFNSDGKVTTVLGGFIDSATSMVIEPGGKIIAAGRVSNGTRDSFGLARYNFKGLLDPTFSGDGKVVTSFGENDGVAQGVAIQPGGRIVCAGGGFGKFLLTRYRANGALDGKFGLGGVVSTTIGNASAAYALNIQKNGRIVACGYNYNGSTSLITAVRYGSEPVVDNRLGRHSNTPKGDDVYNLDAAHQNQNIAFDLKLRPKKWYIGVQNDGVEPDSFTVTGSPGNNNFAIKYYHGKDNVTKEVVKGTFNTGTLAPGEKINLRAKIAALTDKAGERHSFDISSSSDSGLSIDVVRIIAKTE